MAKHRTPSRSGGVPAPDDALAFRAAVRDVKPLAHTPPPQGLAKARPRTRVRSAAAGAAAENLDESMPLIPSPLVPMPPIGGSDTLSFQRAGVRNQVVRRLRRGLIPIDGELDLHGLNQSAARTQLAEFLAHGRAAGMRCVRIVHGKGSRSGARGPVLKTAVDLWLRRHFDVMAFTSARALDGGTGAVYVLLRA